MVVQILGERVGDDAIVHGCREQLLLRVPGQIGPYLQGGTTEQGCELNFVHVRWLRDGGGAVCRRRGILR
jgi:hypothetical protein